MGEADVPESRIAEIWETHQDQWNRIGLLEKNMEEAVMLKRRRIANLLDETPTYRKSHLRLFISYRTNDDETKDGHSVEVIVEGKLLIGHLDHKRAKELDDELYGGQVNPDVDPSDRSQYRGGISERESDVPVEPIQFTHFFDKFQAVLYTVWQPADSKLPTTKRQKGKRQHNYVEDKLQASSKLILVWHRENSTEESPTTGNSSDSNAFVIPYTCPEPPTTELKFHSIVVELQLWPREEKEALYQPNLSLAKALFPQHTDERTQTRGIGKKKSRTNAKQHTSVEKETIPIESSISIPSLLTMKEVITAIFSYIKFKKLQDEHEQSMVNCDKTLQSLFECERFNFADLQFLLSNKELIVQKSNEPMSFIYIIDPNCSNQQQLLSLDIDVNVPSLFHYRCRELLRRIKQREFEYTSSRTKARNWLMSGRASEDRVRQLLEDCVVGKGYTLDHIGAWAALGRAAPEGSEARHTALIDAQICFLLDRAEHHAKAAQGAWDIVSLIRCPTKDKKKKGETVSNPSV
mmetsp:Transcript_27682/g.41903  ORF Transcript_27682/g.41903 Transcript_27682/m.41903 type:complete len:521 (-) Transcript_27682:219-1781(-)